MKASEILITIAILCLAASVWDDQKSGGRLTPQRKTYLLVACMFAVIYAVICWSSG